MFFPSLSRNLSRIHPNHDIKFPSWLQGLGKFQRDINTTWKITAGRKTALDPTSSGCGSCHSSAPQKASALDLPWMGAAGPAEPRPWGRSSAITPIQGSHPHCLPSPLHLAHLQGPAQTSLLQAGFPDCFLTPSFLSPQRAQLSAHSLSPFSSQA